MKKMIRRLVPVLGTVVTLSTPLLLVACAQARFGGWSPLHGSGPLSGWVWRAADVLTEPVTPSLVVDAIVRLGLVIGWVAVVAVVASVPAEVRALRAGAAGRSGLPARLARYVVGGVLMIAQPLTGSLGSVLAAEAVPVEEAAIDEAPSEVGTPAASWLVASGDSVYGIAERLAEGDLSRVFPIADGILELNLGRVMSDGSVFASPAMIRPGWQLDLPEMVVPADPVVDVAPEVVPEEAPVVVPGEPVVVSVEEVPTTAPVIANCAVDEPVAIAPTVMTPPPDGRWVEAAGATMLAAGVVGGLAVRRRRGLRRVRPGQRPRGHAPALVEVERTVMAGAVGLDALDGMVRLDVAIRSALPLLVDAGRRIRWVESEAKGLVRLVLDGLVDLPEPWHPAGECTWELNGLPEVSDGVFPCPTIVQIGATPDGIDVFIDLEMSHGVAIEGDGATVAMNGIVAALAVSPLAGSCVVSETDHEPDDVECSSRPWEDRVVLDDPAPPLLWLHGTTLRPSTAAPDEPPVVLRRRDSLDGWQLGDDGPCVQPLMLANEERVAIDELLSDTEPIDEPVHADPLPMSCSDAPAIVVRVLGEPSVELSDGTPITFERSKSTELVVWMATHRERPTRARARAALWDEEIRSATFSNVLSDARRSLARAVAPPPDEEWIDRTMTEELGLHPLVMTDADLLQRARTTARPLPPESAIEVLRPALELVRGLPFAGTAYLWSDPEGITSEFVVLATGAAAELASWYLAVGDLDGVIWATSRGLQVLPGHEELIALRMRARAARGDTAGLRQEWASYERVLADEWSGGEPAPELVQLRRELLAARASASAST